MGGEMRYKKDTVVITLSLTPDRAKQVLGRLWASGNLTDEQYKRKMLAVDKTAFDNNAKKNANIKKLYSNIKKFYEPKKNN